MRAIRCLIFFLMVTSTSYAQTAAERAASLKEWKQQCNEPDPDLRLAYIEDAIATGDKSIQRICLRLALESDSADIQNLGLRAAIATLDRVHFNVEPASEEELEYQNSGKFTQINSAIKNGISFEPEEALPSDSNSVWYSFLYNTTKNENYVGSYNIIGSELTWRGIVYIPSTYSCSITSNLEEGSVLRGFLQCETYPKFQIEAKLL